MDEGRAATVIIASVATFAIVGAAICTFLLVGKLFTDSGTKSKPQLPECVPTKAVVVPNNEEILKAANIGFQDGAFWGALAMYNGLIKTNIFEEAAYQASALKARVRAERVRKEKEAAEKQLTNGVQ